MTSLVLAALLTAPLQQAPPAFDAGVRQALVWPDSGRRAADWISTGLVAGAIAAPCLEQHTASCWRTQALRVGVAMGVSEVVKRALDRDRPNQHDRKSMPSMHTAIACAATARSEWWPLCPAVGYLRIAADWHWATDVLAGAALGSVTVTISW